MARNDRFGAARAVRPSPRTPGAPLSRAELADHLDATRWTISRLVALDGMHGSAEVAPIALRRFRWARRVLDESRWAPELTRDLRTVTAELGELSGWLLFDAERHGEARAVNIEALDMARLAGDTAMRWFIRTNQALASVHLGRAREALRISTGMNDQADLPRRVRALFDVRTARALASLGDGNEASRVFDRARHTVEAGTTARDPAWSWWFDERELVGHEGMMHADLGNHDKALACLATAVELSEGRDQLRWACYVHRANLLQACLAAGSWSDAERIAADVARMIGEVASARTDTLVRRAVTFPQRRPALSSTLDDTLGSIARRLRDAHIPRKLPPLLEPPRAPARRADDVEVPDALLASRSESGDAGAG